ncbi:MAG: HAD hydrolase-like protein [Acidobacteria bacterium]|nr:HAD hydrolase-like protein [Acidobacteriota bacterium]
MLTGGAGGRAMSGAFEEVFGIANAFAGVPMDGRTDAWLLARAIDAHGVTASPGALARFHRAYPAHLQAELGRAGPRRKIMPGVRPLLRRLAPAMHVFLALLTGNTEAGARLKLEHFDLWRFFSCGAFGDRDVDRNLLLPAALARVQACGGPIVPASQVIVIGDTPLDVACAFASGARAIAVATGGHDARELRAAGADVVFETLEDTGAVVSAIAHLTAAAV